MARCGSHQRTNPRLFLHHSIQQATIDHAVIPYPVLRPGGGAAVARGSFVVPFCYSMKVNKGWRVASLPLVGMLSYCEVVKLLISVSVTEYL
ncbi:hypothetical protein ZWY2020_044528 [Hordeum vulgare]|nr:hypothetical protein ZWY2020_044528 [Hordeum vulgare]